MPVDRAGRLGHSRRLVRKLRLQYGVFSIGFSQIETVRKYVAGQEEHHRKVSFQDEFRELLRRYEPGFDERYLWD
jgi:hypothetical protein